MAPAPLLPTSSSVNLPPHKGPVNALKYSSGAQQYLLSGSSDRSIHLYNPAKTGQAALIQQYTGAHTREIRDIAVSSSNSHIASCGGDKTVFVWDVSTAQTVRRLGGIGGHAGTIECVTFAGKDGAKKGGGGLGTSEESVVVSAGFDASIRFWDLRSNATRPIQVFNDAKDTIMDLEILNDVEIWSGGVDGRMRGYDVRMGMVREDVVGHSITSLVATLAGDSLLVTTLDSKIRLFDRIDGTLLKVYEHRDYKNEEFRSRSALGAKDTVVLSASESGSINIWDVMSGERVQVAEHYVDRSSSQNKVLTAVVCRRKAKDWASAASDGTIVFHGSA